VVFDCRKEGSANLYLVNADGGPIRRLTSDPGYDGEARWSRDGKWIYFWSDRSGRSEVYKMAAGGGEAIQITKNGGQCAVESPDGKWLYYSKGGPYIFDARWGTAAQGSIWRVPIYGGSESQVIERFLSYPYNFVVVDDGVYFINAIEKGTSLEFIHLQSGKTRTVCSAGKGWSYGLSISPDYRWMLCTLSERGPNDLMLVESFR